MNKLFKPTTSYNDMRDAFFEELFIIASKDQDVILLHADQGALTYQKFYQNIPKQIINVGIAEQNMISLAAGLALSGKKVFVHAISSFTTLRCYEQIKIDLSLMNLPVTIAGIGAGFTYGSDGPTHHANQDIACLRAIPHLRLLNASDCSSLSAFPHLAYQNPQLTYIRFDKGNYPIIYTQADNYYTGVKEVISGSDGVILSTGIFVHKALELSIACKQYKLSLGVIDIYQLKPLSNKLLNSLLKKYSHIICLEEHLAYGGLGTIISDFLTDYNYCSKFLRLGLSDKHCFVYGNREFMHQKNNLSNKNLLNRIIKFLR